MTQQANHDPAGLYEGAVQWTGAKLKGVQPQQQKDPTPCTDWDVPALMNHLVDGATRAVAVLSGTEYQKPSVDGTASDYEALTNKALEFVKAPGAMEKIVKGFRGDVVAGEYLVGSFMDTLTHGWDLAVATKQDATMPAHLAEACYTIYEPRKDRMRGGTAFGPEVEVPENASTQVKLLGIFGRKA